MRTYLAAGLAIVGAAMAGLFLLGRGIGDGPSQAVAADSPLTTLSNPLIVHEWGTFTSFSGSNGALMGFTPDNSDLPPFVHVQEGDPLLKTRRLERAGTVSMETPVMYFYPQQEMKASVKVNFPGGWITEWYPFAAGAPSSTDKAAKNGGQGIRWNVRLRPGEQVRFPREKEGNHYYHARETDAAPVEAEVAAADSSADPVLKGGNLVQREKFLFYRGVGTFTPPLGIRALGNGRVRINNALPSRVDGLVLLKVEDQRLKFKALGSLDGGKELDASLSELDSSAAALSEVMVRQLTAAGLYEKESQAMVKTWNSAWFQEPGTRLLYLVPRTRADELLPLTIEPKPTEIVRVLVGRHDFLTPEQEAATERSVEKVRAAQAELAAAENEIQKIGRFTVQAREMARKRIESRSAAR